MTSFIVIVVIVASLMKNLMKSFATRPMTLKRQYGCWYISVVSMKPKSARDINGRAVIWLGRKDERYVLIGGEFIRVPNKKNQT